MMKGTYFTKTLNKPKNDTEFSKLTPEQWKVILDTFQRQIYNLPPETEIIEIK